MPLTPSWLRPSWPALLVLVAMAARPGACPLAAEEATAAAASEALVRALDWLQANQGPQGDWNSRSAGVASLAALAGLAAGHAPARGSRGQLVQGAIEFLATKIAEGTSGTGNGQAGERLNLALAVVALTQAYGTCDDPRIGQALDRAMRRLHRHMRADAAAGASPGIGVVAWEGLALEGATQCGLNVAPELRQTALQLAQAGGPPRFGGVSQPAGEEPPGGQQGAPSLAEAAGWLVVWQVFAPDEPRRRQAFNALAAQLQAMCADEAGDIQPATQQLQVDPALLALAGLALAREEEEAWQPHLLSLRQWLVRCQRRSPEDPLVHGSWQVATAPAQPSAAATAAAALVLALPNRTLPVVP